MAQTSKSASIKNIYNEISKEFSATRQYIWPDLKPFLSEIKPGSTVLDLGCGNGRALLGLPKDIKYTGVDISSNLLLAAKAAHPNHIFIEGDITQEKTWNRLPKADHIICIAVIHHIASSKEHQFVLKQIKKHLNPEGKVLITAWNLWQKKYLKRHLDLKTKLQNLHHVYITFQGKPRFHYAFTTSYLKRLSRSSNLKLQVQKSRFNYILHT